MFWQWVMVIPRRDTDTLKSCLESELDLFNQGDRTDRFI